MEDLNMRYFSNLLPFTILFWYVNITQGQDINQIDFKIDSLKQVESTLKLQLQNIINQISELNQKKLILSTKIDTVKTTVETKLRINGKLKDAPSVFGKTIIDLKQGEKVIIISYEQDDYYKVKSGDYIGFLSAMYLEPNPELEKQKKSREKKEQVKKEKERKEYLIQKYGDRFADKILAKEIWIGMTKDMLIESWGEPQKINRTVLLDRIHEQWIYPNVYIYFENDILVSWQD